MPDLSLAISLLKPEEAEQYMRIRHIAFQHDVNKIFYFNAPGHEPSEATLNRVTRGIAEGIAKNVFYLKCVDTTTNQMIAGARWRYVRPEDPNATFRTWDEVNKELTIPEPFAESNPEVFRAFHELFGETKRKLLGTRPYWVLDTLVTHPEHHRRGAGGMLLKWGCEKADEAKMETYLEASEMGAPLYERYGFEPKEHIALDLRNWDGEEEIKWTAMIRPAKISG